MGRRGAVSRERRFHSKHKQRSRAAAGATANHDGVGLLTRPLLLCRQRGHLGRAAPASRIGRAGELRRGGAGLPLVTFAEVPLDNVDVGEHRVGDVCDAYTRIAPDRQGRSLPVWTKRSSAYRGSDEMTAPLWPSSSQVIKIAATVGTVPAYART
jgi:hypothetical protein